MITGPPLSQDGGLADRRVRPDDTGQRIEAGLVYEANRLLLFLRPFLMAGQVSSRHGAIAASFR